MNPFGTLLFERAGNFDGRTVFGFRPRFALHQADRAPVGYVNGGKKGQFR